MKDRETPLHPHRHPGRSGSSTRPITRGPILAAILLPTAFLLIPATVHAQSREGGPVLLELPTGASTVSLGTAVPLSRPGAERIFHNPALVSGDGFSLGASFFGEHSTYLHLAGSADWGGGSVALGVQSLSYSVDAPSIGTIPPGPDHLLRGGATGVSELVASAAYSRRDLGFRWGMTGKLLEQRFESRKGTTAAVDVGVARRIGSFMVGLAAQNLGPDLDVDGSEEALAERLSLGAAFHGWEAGALDLGTTGAISREADGSWIPAAGVEVAWWPVVGRTFIGRVGMRRVVDSAAHEVTFGGGFMGDEWAVEYAFQNSDDLDATHTVTLSWR